MTSWSSRIKICFNELIESIIKKKMSCCETECKKKCAIGETECNRQRIDQKRKKGWGRGRRERIEKGSRERIKIERKETKGK